MKALKEISALKLKVDGFILKILKISEEEASGSVLFL